MDSIRHTPDNDDEDENNEQLLGWLEAAQVHMPPAQTLVTATITTINRKNQIIALLAESLMESDCDCEGCARMRAIIRRELELEPVVVVVVPGAEATTTVQ